MASVVKQFIVRILGDNKDLEKKLDQSNKSVEGFGKSIAKIGTALGIAFGVREIAKFGVEVVKLAAEAEGVRAAFQRISTPGLLKDLRAATKGTVSDLELMRKSVEANNFQLPLNQLASLFEFATKRAQETGQSVDYLVNSIVLGIGRKSPLILDNLGISAIRLRQELGGAGVEMTSVADVAAAVGKIAQQEMEKAGGVIETTGAKLQRLTANWQNFKEKVGQSTINLAINFGDWVRYFEALKDIKEIKALKSAGIDTQAIIEQIPEFAKYFDTWQEGQATIQRTADIVKQAYKDLDKIPKFSPFGIMVTDGLVKLPGVIGDIDVKMSRLTDSLKTASVSRIAEINKELEQLEKQRQGYLNLGRSVDIVKSRKTHLYREDSDSGKLAQKTIDDIDAEIESMMNLEGQVESTASTINASSLIMSDAWSSVSNSVVQMGIDIADTFAISIGAVASGVQTFGDLLGDMSEMILSALGDIMIMAGTFALKLGSPVGIPLVLGGLAVKGIGGIVSNHRAKKQEASGLNNNGMPMQSSTLYGNDIRTANAYATDVYKRVG